MKKELLIDQNSSYEKKYQKKKKIIHENKIRIFLMSQWGRLKLKKNRDSGFWVLLFVCLEHIFEIWIQFHNLAVLWVRSWLFCEVRARDINDVGNQQINVDSQCCDLNWISEKKGKKNFGKWQWEMEKSENSIKIVTLLESVQHYIFVYFWRCGRSMRCSFGWLKSH